MNRKKTGKKAMLFTISLVLITIIVLLTAFVKLSAKEDKFKEYIGERQFDLFTKYSEAESVLLYSDQAAKYAVNDALYKAGNDGGFSEPKCGEYSGYAYWNGEEEGQGIDYCFPDFRKSITAGIEEYLARALSSGIPSLPSDTYDIVQVPKGGSTEFFFFPGSNLVFRSRPRILYEISPALKYTAGYNMGVYSEAKEKAKAIISSCAEEANVRECAAKNFDEFNKEPLFYWSLEMPGTIESLFWDFVETYNSCIGSAQEECICFHRAGAVFPKIKATDETEYRIKISRSGKSTLIDLPGYGLMKKISYQGPYFVEDPGDEFEEQDSVEYALTYDETGMFELAETAWNGLYDWDVPYNSLILYKRENNIAFIDTDEYSKYFSMPLCMAEEGRALMITVKQKPARKLLVYDDSEKEIALKEAVLKFALAMPDKVPPPVVDVRWEKILDEGKRLTGYSLEWGKSKAKDFDHYALYTSVGLIDKDYTRQVIRPEDLEDPGNPSWTLPAREEMTYQFAVTAVDTEGNEDYSKPKELGMQSSEIERMGRQQG